jgi:tetratricopeptide (TPR) repeat protein
LKGEKKVKVSMISYTQTDEQLADALHAVLANKDHFYIRYRHDFKDEAGKEVDFVAEMTDALVDSDYVIALISKAYVLSNWCVKEFIVAHKAKKLIPILIDDCDIQYLLEFEDFIDVRGMSLEQAVNHINREIGVFMTTIQSVEQDETEVFNYVEKTLIVVPLFEGGFEANHWQSGAIEFIRVLFRDENVKVMALPEYVRTQEEALAVRLKYNADFVLYGRFRNDMLEFGFESSRWNYTDDEDRNRISLPEEPVFKVKGRNFSNLTLALKLAYGNLETCRIRVDRAKLHFDEALGVGDNPLRASQAGAEYLYVFQSIFYIKTGEWDRALEYSLMAIDLNPNLFMAWVSKGDALLKLGRNEECITAYTQAIKIDSRIAEIWNNRGAAWLNFGNYDEAISDLTKAIRLDPNVAMAWTNSSMAQYQLKDYEKALSDANEAINLNPRLPLVWHSRSLIQAKLGFLEEAIFDATEAIRLAPSKATDWINRGQFQFELGNFEEALSDATEAIQLDSTVVIVWVDKGRAQFELGNYEVALSDMTKAIQLEPLSKYAWYHRGIAQAKLRNWFSAMSDLARCKELGGEYPELDQILAKAKEKCEE